MSKTNIKKSSRIWLKRQDKDPFVKQSKKDGYRSRAAYKLLEIQQKYSILKAGMKVIDLGAAPGSWSQVAIEPIKNVDIIQGDFTTTETFEQICNLAEGKIDLILSDMAPNLSGIWAVDIPKAMYLSETVINLVKCLLKQEGDLLIKLFHGTGFDKYLTLLRECFAKVIICKPKSSRSTSREVYVLAKGYYG